jgi:1-acyl-sn-glycerol-3-phosphate acyltransferase
VRRYYPRIEIDGGERIPQHGPVLLCANHTNSLLDSVVIGITARRPVRFMAKATLFDHPLFGPPMKALGMVPAFRGMDDQKQVRRNLESLDTGAGVLIDGSAMGIFPEGMSTDQLHLEKVRTGAARMALQAVVQGTTDAVVVPIGIAYQRKEQFRSAVLVRVGEPIIAAEFLTAEDGNVPRARRAITAELDRRLKELAIHLDDPDWEPWLSDLELLAPAAPNAPRTPAAALWQRKRIADAINHFLENDRDRAMSVAHDIQTYRNDVDAAGLQLNSEVLRFSGFEVSMRLLWRFVWLALLLVPALLGTLHFIVPFVVVRRLTALIDQPGRVTTATHKMMTGVPIYTIWHLGATAAIWFYAPRFAWFWLFAAPFAGVLALQYWRRFRRASRLLYHEARAIIGRHRLKALRQQRSGLRARLDELSDEFEDRDVDLVNVSGGSP